MQTIVSTRRTRTNARRLSSCLARVLTPFAFAVAVALGIASVRVEGADLVRVAAPTEDGSFEERNEEGAIVEISASGITLRDVKTNEETTIPSERVLWILLDDAPVELAAARVDYEVGEYESALEKLKSIDASELASSKSAYASTEFDWYQGTSALQLALADGDATLNEGGRGLATFVKNHADSYRYYEALSQLGDAFLAVSREGGKQEASLKRAGEAYERMAQSDSKVYRARGLVGIGDVALETSDYAKAEESFKTVKESEIENEYLGRDVLSRASLGLALTYARSGRYAEARSEIASALEATPRRAELARARLYNALGETNERDERWEDAIIAYLRVDLVYYSARVERVKALKALVSLWSRTGREDRAAETRERLKTRFHVEIE